jgi:hypothetical protein
LSLLNRSIRSSFLAEIKVGQFLRLAGPSARRGRHASLGLPPTSSPRSAALRQLASSHNTSWCKGPNFCARRNRVPRSDDDAPRRDVTPGTPGRGELLDHVADIAKVLANRLSAARRRLSTRSRSGRTTIAINKTRITPPLTLKTAPGYTAQPPSRTVGPPWCPGRRIGTSRFVENHLLS